jgi:hypothetical protein
MKQRFEEILQVHVIELLQGNHIRIELCLEHQFIIMIL